ncbi:MAG TPA: hypothetical protein VJ739_04595 [Gemmataceae bacterium]|nr:hypothetical protein [Gemmataceae bacterium]
MTSQGNGQPARYRVILSGVTRTALAQLSSKARQEGAGQEFLAAVREIGRRLRNDPLGFGEPRYRLPALRLLVCEGMIAPLVVNFAVHEDRPLVFIRGFRLLL